MVSVNYTLYLTQSDSLSKVLNHILVITSVNSQPYKSVILKEALRIFAVFNSEIILWFHFGFKFPVVLVYKT